MTLMRLRINQQQDKQTKVAAARPTTDRTTPEVSPEIVRAIP